MSNTGFYAISEFYKGTKGNELETLIEGCGLRDFMFEATILYGNEFSQIFDTGRRIGNNITIREDEDPNLKSRISLLRRFNLYPPKISNGAEELIIEDNNFAYCNFTRNEGER